MLINDGAIITFPKNVDLKKYMAKTDVRCCLTTSSGKRICVTTYGDNDKMIVKNKEFVDSCNNVDVGITATRNYDSSIEAMWNHYPFSLSEVFRIPKIDCQHIYKMVGIKDKNSKIIESKQIVDMTMIIAINTMQ